MKIKKTYSIWIILSVTGIILGHIFRSPPFFILPVATLALMVVSTRVMPPKRLSVSIDRESDERKREIYVGDEIEMKVKIENNLRRSLILEVQDILPPMVEVIEGSNHKVMKFDKNEEKVLKYTLKCPVTGNIELGPLRIRYVDPLNFFSKERNYGDKVILRILPRAQEMQGVDINPSYTKHWLGDIKSRTIGVGSDFFSLREYHPGDEIRDINWKATARYFDPFTNEYEGEKSGDVILVVDGYKKSMVGTTRHNTLRVSIDAAASLASSILSARNRLGLIVSGEYVNWVYPGTGKNHYHKILANLTQFEKGGSWGLEGVKNLLEDFFPRKSLIIFISPLTIIGFTETIIDLSRKEYDVMVISPDPIKIEETLTEEKDELAEMICDIERKNIIERLWNAGTVVVDWDPNEPLEPALEEVLRYKEKR